MEVERCLYVTFNLVLSQSFEFEKQHYSLCLPLEFFLLTFPSPYKLFRTVSFILIIKIKDESYAGLFDGVGKNTDYA
jgi:hypothetical protein